MASEKIVKEFSNLLDNIYNGFVLRDIFAKIVPGLILIISFFYLFTDDPSKIEKLTQFSWILLIGLSWIVAFGIQSIGEKTKLIRYYTKDYDKNKNWIVEYNKFLAKATNTEKSNCERLVVIKEATGNLSISLFISTLIISMKLLFNDWRVVENSSFWIVIIFIVLFSYFLHDIHKTHVKKQCEYLEEVNERKKSTLHNSKS